ncbi:RHS repeat-associated core domain-containing protein, partial [Salmonella enterica]
QLIRLPGQQYDDETGLYYNRYRYYNPEQGRYISQDPIGLRGGWNLYTYPLNPVSGTDPLGLFVPLVIAGYYISAEVVALASSGLAAVTAALSTPSGQQVVQNAANAISNTYYQIASQAMIENPGLIAFVAGQNATGRSLVDSGNAMADSYQSIFSDPCGAFASVFGGDDSGNPNVGKDLTDEEKNELGGIGSGAPGGPEDEDEWNKVQSTGSSEGEIKNTYGSIKDAPQYPKGFRSSQNGTVKNVVKNREVLESLRKVESGKWSKVYKDGYDASGRRVSIHYFESQSGRVFNVKVKPEWSNFK